MQHAHRLEFPEARKREGFSPQIRKVGRYMVVYTPSRCGLGIKKHIGIGVVIVSTQARTEEWMCPCANFVQSVASVRVYRPDWSILRSTVCPPLHHDLPSGKNDPARSSIHPKN